jgi:hypothetical protein
MDALFSDFSFAGLNGEGERHETVTCGRDAGRLVLDPCEYRHMLNYTCTHTSLAAHVLLFLTNDQG